MARRRQPRRTGSRSLLAALIILVLGLLPAVFVITRSLAAGPDADPDPPAPRGAPDRPLTYAFTIDNVTDIAGITDYLTSLPGRPTVRIVFDQWRTARSYAAAVRAIAAHADIVGQLLDSSAMREYSTDQYLERTREFTQEFSGEVAVWEVGNEVNGEWLGSREQVRDKVVGANEIVRAMGEKTALTLFYNPKCYQSPANLMAPWVQHYLSPQDRAQFDYVLISYYSQDCADFLPESWDPIFEQVGELFPHALLGFGEVGLTSPVTADTLEQAQETMRYYYAQRPTTDRFIGGWFWWYARQDLIESPHLLRDTYREILDAS